MEKIKVQIEFCPICGSAPVLEKTSLDNGNGHGYPGHYDCAIKCISCGMPTPQSATTVYYKSEQDAVLHAIKKWNRQSRFIINNYLLKNIYLKKLMQEEK